MAEVLKSWCEGCFAVRVQNVVRDLEPAPGGGRRVFTRCLDCRTFNDCAVLPPKRATP